MYLWRTVLLFSFNFLRQRHDISVLLFIVRSHALWRGRMSEFLPIRNHYHVHLVEHSTRIGCFTFCWATPCWREQTSSKQLSTVAAFCWFSVWSLSCRCRVKFSMQSYQPCINLSRIEWHFNLSEIKSMEFVIRSSWRLSIQRNSNDLKCAQGTLSGR